MLISLADIVDQCIFFSPNCTETNVTAFSPSFQVLTNGPKIVIAVEIDAEGKGMLSVATK